MTKSKTGSIIKPKAKGIRSKKGTMAEAIWINRKIFAGEIILRDLWGIERYCAYWQEISNCHDPSGVNRSIESYPLVFKRKSLCFDLQF